MRRLVRALSIIGLLVPASRQLAAQRVAGMVVLADSTTPLARAIVRATDARGITVGQTLTTGRGEFTLAVPGSGRYTIAVLRIGYRPTTVSNVTVSDSQTVRIRIVATDAIVTLAALTVRERETCRVNADTGLMVARVWNEARKAMLTTQLSSDTAPLRADWIEYDRALDSTGRIVRTQSIRSSSHATTHAFHSVPADILHREGYVVADGAGITYYAPDAEVLLSDMFTADHCFHLVEAPDSQPPRIGVGFAPNRDRRDMRDIEGTLWVERASAELQLLEFRYVNLPDVANDAQPGGRVEFLRLDDGNWLVNRWTVRMPQLAVRPRESADGNRRTVMASNRTYLQAVRVTGGEVTRAVHEDSVVYRATGPSIVVQVTSGATAMDVAGAQLTLDGTDYHATADSAGLIRLSPVLAGRYRARVQTPLLERLGMPATLREVTTDAGVHVDSISLPSARDAVAKVCPRDAISNGEGMLHGQVRDEAARPVSGVAVTTRWKDNFSIVAVRENIAASYGEKTLIARTDASGYWRVCGVPRDTPASIAVTTDSTSDVQTARLLEQPFALVDLVLHRRALGAGAVDTARRSPSRAFVEILVTDERGAAVPDATLDVQSIGSPRRTIVTSEAGRALVADVRPGRVDVSARRIGFKPGRLSAIVDSGRSVLPIRLSATSIPMLDTQRVVGARFVAGRFAEVEARRQAGVANAVFTREDIIKRNPVDAWQMLTAVASLEVIQTGSNITVESARGFDFRNQKITPCYLMIMVDGVVINPRGDAVNLNGLPAPDNIYAIEVFAGPARIPPQYAVSNNRCGLIAIWTR